MRHESARLVMMRFLFLVMPGLLLGALTIFAQGSAGISGLGEPVCGKLRIEGKFGPFDYRRPTTESRLEEVERLHFTPHYTAMMRGKDIYIGAGGGYVTGGFHYTLWAFPNHPRALQALDTYSRKKKMTESPPGLPMIVECYFDRALRFQPEDSTVRFLYANYLIARNRKADAAEQLALVDTAAESNPQLAYNIGLLYVSLGNYEKARKHAKFTYQAGFNLPGLRNKLVELGQWEIADEVKPPAADPASATPQAAEEKPQTK